MAGSAVGESTEAVAASEEVEQMELELAELDNELADQELQLEELTNRVDIIRAKRNSMASGEASSPFSARVAKKPFLTALGSRIWEPAVFGNVCIVGNAYPPLVRLVAKEYNTDPLEMRLAWRFRAGHSVEGDERGGKGEAEAKGLVQLCNF
jgi:hypothetical protein